MLRTLISWIIGIAIVIYFIKHGGQIGGWVHEAATSISAFISSATS